METMGKSSAARRLKVMEQSYLSLCEFLADAVFEMNREGRLIRVNPACSLISGYSAEELLHMDVLSLLDEKSREKAKVYYPLVLKGHFDRLELVMVRKDAARIHIECNMIPVDIDGHIESFFVIVKDVTAPQIMDVQSGVVLNSDPLTGLPNREQFVRRLEQLAGEGGGAGQAGSYTLIYLNVDRLQFINDSLGYVQGDLLLQHVAAVLRELLTPGGLVARMNGDEFALLSPASGEAQAATELADKAASMLSAPLQLLGLEIIASASMGIVLLNGSSSVEAGNLIGKAVMAMRHAKKHRPELQYALYTEEMDARLSCQLQLESGLRSAILLNQFYLRYQPIVNVYTGTIEAVEALLRWEHPELGIVPPDTFIPIAEETGEIIAIGGWVLRTACRQIRSWHDEGLILRIAVNVSLLQLREPDFPLFVKRVLDEAGLEPKWLDIEITESVLIEDQEQMKARLAELRSIGVHVAIDDFGTGYTSLNYLKNFPIDYLKIDRSFIRDINNDANNNIILASLIELAHHLKIQVIGEGIETQEQIEFLRSKGCDEGQGYLVSAAVDADEIWRLCSRLRP